MTDELKKTVKITRKPKVTTDDRGRTVWVDTVITANLELVSTQMLKQIIDADDIETREQLRDIAEGKDGLLAHDIDKGRFEIISAEELQHILDGTDMEPGSKLVGRVTDVALAETVNEEEELELVSTQMLRKIILAEDENQAGEPDQSGFDPYNHGR